MVGDRGEEEGTMNRIFPISMIVVGTILEFGVGIWLLIGDGITMVRACNSEGLFYIAMGVWVVFSVEFGVVRPSYKHLKGEK